MNRLGVNICGVEFKNPIIAASGTFGYGVEYAQVYDLSLAGGIAVKGISLNPTNGNQMPRIHETSSGMLNAIGLQNIGVNAFLKDKLPTLRKYDCKIIVNFWGKSIDEYQQVARILDDADVDMLEMNISCPNVKAGGHSFSSYPAAAATVVAETRKVVKNKPLIVKLSPNVTDIKEYAIAIQDAGADALSAINTLIGMAINIRTRKPWLANVTGGLSGPAIKPVAIRMVHEVFKTVKIPVIGIGGITNHEDVVEFFLAGASCVQVGTANFVEHDIIPKIAVDLDKYCEENQIDKISSLVGKVEIG